LKENLNQNFKIKAVVKFK